VDNERIIAIHAFLDFRYPILNKDFEAAVGLQYFKEYTVNNIFQNDL
jgi:hypothetical protein